MTPRARAQTFLQERTDDLESQYEITFDYLVALLTTFAALENERLVQVVNGLIGKDSGNWNRAIAHAAHAIHESNT